MNELRPLELGWVRTDLRRRLVGLVLAGVKTATAGLAEEEEWHCSTGELLELLGFDDEPVAIVKVTDARIVPAGEIDEQFVRDEGEWFKTVAEWRKAHEEFYRHPIPDDTPIEAVRFRVIERLATDQPTARD